MLLSLRALEPDKDAEKLILRIVGRKGTGGGPETIAGGQIPLRRGGRSEKRQLERTVRRRFRRLLGAENLPEEKLIR